MLGILFFFVELQNCLRPLVQPKRRILAFIQTITAIMSEAV